MGIAAGPGWLGSRTNCGAVALGDVNLRIYRILGEVFGQGLAQKLPGPFNEAVHRAGGGFHFFGNFLIGEVAEAL